jgi:arsenate reductase-like glutaredoxin family protein
MGVVMSCRCLGSVDVAVYGVPSSVEGKQVRAFFESKGIGYREIDVSVDPQGMQKLRALSGQSDRPAIVVNGRVFVGFDRSQLESAVPSRY